MSETFEKVAQTISESYDVPHESISVDSHILRDLGLDSIDLYDLTFAIEDLFDVSIPTEKWGEETDEKDLSEAPIFTMKMFCARIDQLVAEKAS